MALIKPILVQKLYDYFSVGERDPLTAAKELATIIDDYIKSATVMVTVAPGILVTTPVGPGATTTPGTGTGNLV